MHRIKKLAVVILSILTISSVCVFGGSFSAGASGTGAGLAEWALNAYYSGWSYVWGGSSPGAVDCSGLIYSYCGGNRTSMLSDAQANGRDWGYVSSGVPRVHGLGLSRPGHVGVYIEDGMEVDARGSAYGVCYQAIGGYNSWDCWFKLTAVSYTTNGWEKFNGNYYYYENGQYIVNTSRTIDGTTYYFDSKGRSSTTPSNTSSSSSSSSSGSKSSGSSSSSAPTTWRNGSTGEEVTKIQKRLTELGFYTGAIDGSFGDGTEEAYIAFQKAAGVTVDGIAGSDREVLYSDSAPYASSKSEDKTEEKTEEAADAPEEETTVAEDEPETNEISIVNGDFSDDVSDVQARLAELGYFGMEATGYFGDYTAQAIAAFQTANGLEATGELDSETYALLYSEDAVVNPEPIVNEDEQAAAISSESGPSQIVAGITPSSLILSNETNQTYADTASQVAAKTNKVTEKALAKSSSVIPSVETAKVKRTANIWIWFVLTAIILGAVSFVFIRRDKKHNRYDKYIARKKKNSTRAQLNARW